MELFLLLIKQIFKITNDDNTASFSYKFFFFAEISNRCYLLIFCFAVILKTFLF